MRFSVLLITADMEARPTIQRSLASLDMDVTPCSSFECAVNMISDRSFHAVVADCDIPRIKELFQFVQKRRDSVVPILVALLKQQGKAADAFAIGATLAIPKPIRSARAFQTLQTFLLTQERKRSSFKVAVSVQLRGMELVSGRYRGTELSQTQLVLDSDGRLRCDSEASYSFVLPNTDIKISGRAPIVLLDNNLFALKLDESASNTTSALRSWLADRFDQELRTRVHPVYRGEMTGITPSCLAV